MSDEWAGDFTYLRAILRNLTAHSRNPHSFSLFPNVTRPDMLPLPMMHVSR